MFYFDYFKQLNLYIWHTETGMWGIMGVGAGLSVSEGVLGSLKGRDEVVRVKIAMSFCDRKPYF